MSLSLNLESIILLLFFIAPGFLFTRTYTAYRPRYYREPTGFEQFVLAVVGSTIIHAAILTIIALAVLIYWAVSRQTFYLSNLFDPSMPLTGYPLPVLALLSFAGTVYLALSLIAARRFATFLGRGAPADRPKPSAGTGGRLSWVRRPVTRIAFCRHKDTTTSPPSCWTRTAWTRPRNTRTGV